MIVCDRCKQELKGAVTNLKILGIDYSLCMDCAEATGNYIKYSGSKGNPLVDKIKRLFKK